MNTHGRISKLKLETVEKRSISLPLINKLLSVIGSIFYSIGFPRQKWLQTQQYHQFPSTFFNRINLHGTEQVVLNNEKSFLLPDYKHIQMIYWNQWPICLTYRWLDISFVLHHLFCDVNPKIQSISFRIISVSFPSFYSVEVNFRSKYDLLFENILWILNFNIRFKLVIESCFLFRRKNSAQWTKYTSPCNNVHIHSCKHEKLDSSVLNE